MIYKKNKYRIICWNVLKIFNNKKKEILIRTKKSSNLNLFNSKDYWEKRYANGGNSGYGSYNNLAKFKAEVINNFIKKHNINNVIEWGSGDCNQLSLINYKYYIGYDVSKTAIENCKKKYYNDSTKAFIYLSDNFVNNKTADLSVSLDVIFHLVEDNFFILYMNNLFDSSNKYVCIYSSNYNQILEKHVKHRKFTDWIDNYISKNWKLKEYIPNKYPFVPSKGNCTSLSNFYFYEKINWNFNHIGKIEITLFYIGG